MLHHHPHRRLVGKRQLARQHFENHHAQRVEVGAVIHGRAHDLFGRHVGRRAQDVTGLRQAQRTGLISPSGLARNAKVAHQHVALAVKHDVGRLDVPMDDTLPMSIVQRGGDLSEQMAQLVKRQTTDAQHVLEGAAVHVAHDNVGRVVRAVEIVHRQDVGMLQPRDDARLAPEALHRLRVIGNGLVENFDRHMAVNGGLVCTVDCRHATFTHLCDDFIGAETCSNHDSLSPVDW